VSFWSSKTTHLNTLFVNGALFWRVAESLVVCEGCCQFVTHASKPTCNFELCQQLVGSLRCLGLGSSNTAAVGQNLVHEPVLLRVGLLRHLPDRLLATVLAHLLRRLVVVAIRV